MRGRVGPFLIGLALAVVPPRVGHAHPHIFIDAGLELIHGADGRVVEMRITWRYDELYSLLLLQDYGLDPDFDGALTEAEIDATLGFDLNWGAGFEGGLVASAAGQMLQIGAPAPVSLILTESGQLETVHRRPVLDAPAADEIEASIYDEAFYIAFEMILPTVVTGRAGCEAALLRADLDSAYAILDAEIERLGGAISAEDNFPPVGAIFADRVRITCPGE